MRERESIRAMLGSLVSWYCVDHDIDLLPFGSWTIKRKRIRRSAEPDPCYVFGVRRTRPRRPDLAIEVIWTSGGIDKLEVWRKLRVPEVWMWRDGGLRVYRLRGESYRPIPRSQWLPDLDLDLLCRFIDRPTLNQSLREFRAALAARA